MQQLLDTLARAISDVGYWRWWTGEDLPKSFQMEFGGTQLRFEPPEEGLPPSGLVALRFVNPTDVVFLDLSEEVPANWFELLHQDQLEPFNVDGEAFAFNDLELARQLLEAAHGVHALCGESAASGTLQDRAITLGFAAHQVAVCVTAERMEIYSNRGAIDLDDLLALNGAWWEYWQEYWRLRETDSPLPKDYACEVTIPTG